MDVHLSTNFANIQTLHIFYDKITAPQNNLLIQYLLLIFQQCAFADCMIVLLANIRKYEYVGCEHYKKMKWRIPWSKVNKVFGEMNYVRAQTYLNEYSVLLN